MRRLLLDAKNIHSIRIYHYVFMPNHFHLMVEPEKDGSLSKFMRHISSKYAARSNAVYGTTGHIWQGRYRSRLVDKDSYFIQCGKYIELNPVRSSLVADPKDYRWSSYRFHAYGIADALVDADDLYSSLATNSADVQSKYRKLIIEDLIGIR